MILTYRYRLKDGGSKVNRLRAMSSHVNLVWNLSNEYIRKRWKESRFYTTKSHLHEITKGSSKEILINSQTIQATAYEVLLRVQKTKKKVRFRSRKKNLGFIPFNGQTFKLYKGYLNYNGFNINYWNHRDFPEGSVIKTGSFSEDSEGKWYVNLNIEISDSSYYLEQAPDHAIGIDPGIKSVLTTSDGIKYERENLTKKYAPKLAKAQRQHKKKQITKIHAKIKNIRKDFNHKVSFEIAKANRTIFYGNISSIKLSKTRMAKGILDNGIGSIYNFLEYKVNRRQGNLYKISEKFSTITCSVCCSRSGPKGLSGLKIREWICPICGSKHDRDINSAKNILRFGHETLELCSKAA